LRRPRCDREVLTLFAEDGWEWRDVLSLRREVLFEFVDVLTERGGAVSPLESAARLFGWDVPGRREGLEPFDGTLCFSGSGLLLRFDVVRERREDPLASVDSLSSLAAARISFPADALAQRAALSPFGLCLSAQEIAPRPFVDVVRS
jgi:hypothetical protein